MDLDVKRDGGRAPVITIDGPAGAGKTTAARGLARRLGLAYLDTGAMYRAAALLYVEAVASAGDEAESPDGNPEAGDEVDMEALSGVLEGIEMRFVPREGGDRLMVGSRDVTDQIRTPLVTHWASRLSTIPALRSVMVSLQRALGAAGGVVTEGRDMGTVVFPEAEVKFYMDASPDERARRRFEEMRAAGMEVGLEEVERDLVARDSRDRSRDASPLRPALDAVFIDTTLTDEDGVLEIMLREIRRVTGASA